MEQTSRKGAPARSGLSLLEILVSVFVLSIGLLGVAAVIPLGHHQILEAAKSDRASACGRAAVHEVKIRGWINPSVWRQLAVNEVDPLNANWLPYTYPVTFDTGTSGNPDQLAIPLCDSFAIDPLFFAHYDNSTNPLVWRFPLDATAEGVLTEERRNSLVRVTMAVEDFLITWPAPPPDPPFSYPARARSRMPFAAANRDFTWRDDMLFPIPDDPDDRPRQLVTWDGGQGFAYPLRGTDLLPPALTSPVISQADNNYSWMATVTPIVDEPGLWVRGPIPTSPSVTATPTTPPGPAATPPATPPGGWTAIDYYRSYAPLNQVTRYTVSIVVFYKREFTCPAAANLSDPVYPPQERSVTVSFPGDGFGGGDVFLYYDPAPAMNPLGKTDVWLDVKKDDWIMLRGLEEVAQMTLGGAPPPPVPLRPFRRVVTKWYRVVAVDDVIGETLSNGTPVRGRYVTLDGPDWQVDTDGDGTFEPSDMIDPLGFYGNAGFDWATATLVDNVIGVLTTTVEADFDSM